MTDRREEFRKHGLYDPRFEHDSCGVGFVCDIKGVRSNQIVLQGLEVLKRLSHRGATGADPLTGDGAGILLQLPHEFLSLRCKEEDFKLPQPGDYGCGMVFLPQLEIQRDACKELFSKAAEEEGQSLLGWRSVPVDGASIGRTARETQPVIEQVFIARGRNCKDSLDFERRLYCLRKRVENMVRGSSLSQKNVFYITNISSRTLSYKGLLMPGQLDEFFPELKDRQIKSALALVHSRYSTNTFPTWELAQPFRFLAHNGEINTLRGNINWMTAREGLLKSDLFGADIKRILPVIVPDGSDSATIDNVFELLVLAGRPLAQVMMMLIPAAWERDHRLDRELADFYRYHSCLMEPWDGPAAMAFTDGTCIGAVLDRNGLRPARYLITKQGFVVMASETGVLDIASQDILISGRIEPGKMLYIDTAKGKIIQDVELKRQIAKSKPYGDWLRDNLVNLNDLPAGNEHMQNEAVPPALLSAFGYTREDLKVIIKPMCEGAQEPIGSMGNDTPLAVFSNAPQLLYNYFKHLFAQVTNPAIDPIREELIMSLQTCIGPESNILEETPRHCHKLRVKRPVLTNEELEKIRGIRKNSFKSITIPILYDPLAQQGLKNVLEGISRQAERAIEEGYTFIILSDRGISLQAAAVPALLAVGALHQYLTRKALRTRIGIILESAEPREVHHFALLFGYGADCVNPYGAYAAVKKLCADNEINTDEKTALKNYIKAVDKGILKILSKMGISTLQSYRGAQIFEALGVAQEVIEHCFTGTVSRIGGADFAVLEKEALLRQRQAFARESMNVPYLATGGVYQWKKDGEFHLWNPESIAALQDAARNSDPDKYSRFCELINNQAANPCTIRGMFRFRKTDPVDIKEVEPVSEIVKRFAVGAMSFGSISRRAHETIAIAMNRLGARSNTGEGGEDPARFTPLANGDSLRSSVKQVASGRFGVTTNYLINADELQIKIAQGAKPGEGGQLPGHKVSAIIAKTRYTTPGVTLISPPPHHDIYSIEDLAQLIFDLKNTNPRARISVKLVSEIGVGTVAAGVAKGHADMILISGGDGGTGASPLSSIKHAGLPWELGLSEANQTLVLNDLRSRVRLQADGQMRTGRDVAIAALLGAEEFGFASAVLVVLGCVMLRHCHLNTCSLGVATQDDILQERFSGRPEQLINYFTFVAQELRTIMASLGIRTVNEMVGRSDLLDVDESMLPWKARKADFSRILFKPQVPESVGRYCSRKQEHDIDHVLDRELIAQAKIAIDKGSRVHIEMPIHNTNRTTGAMLSGEVCRMHGESGLPEDTIYCRFKGVAGQSFGAFLGKGITFELEGMANDYVGKGISGGKIIVYPDSKAELDDHSNIIMGNTTFYGAICGQAYIRGTAGERFCIRNSGLEAVVEGVGDHGCEYMTGGTVVVIGPTGRNFAAGMSGGVAYVYDPDMNFHSLCNMGMVNLEMMEKEDTVAVHNLLVNHFKYTRSLLARIILDSKEEMMKFIKVMPMEYKRVLEERKQSKKRILSESELIA